MSFALISITIHLKWLNLLIFLLWSYGMGNSSTTTSANVTYLIYSALFIDLLGLLLQIMNLIIDKSK